MITTTEAMDAMDKTDRLAISVEEAAKRLGLSRGLTYEAVRRGEIPSIRIGRRILVPRVALEQLLYQGRSDALGKNEDRWHSFALRPPHFPLTCRIHKG